MSIVAPGHLRGVMFNANPHRDERTAWIMQAREGGASVAQIAAALNIRPHSVALAIRKVAGPLGRDNARANDARLANAHRLRHGSVRGLTYAELHARGMTAQEAAAERGESPQTARRWAAEVGVKWADGRSHPEMRARSAQHLATLAADRRAGLDRLKSDPERSRLAALTAAQRDDYETLLRFGYLAADALRAIGRADLAERPARIGRRRLPKPPRRRRRDIEADMAALMAAEAPALNSAHKHRTRSARHV